MRIESSETSRIRSTDDLEPSAPQKTDGPRPLAPVLARLESALDAVNAAAARGEDVSAIRPKLERILKDVKDLHEALGPFGEQMGEAKEAAEAIEASVHILVDACYHPMILPAVAPVALSGIAMGLVHYSRALDGMRREAPDAVERAAPVVERLRRDIDDLEQSFRPRTAEAPIDRPAYVRA